MQRISVSAATLLCVTLLSIGVAYAGTTGPSPGVTPVSCVGTTYSPDLVTIPVGGTVEWGCNFITHPLVSDDNYWEEFGGLASQSLKFLEDGTFAYHCKIHGSSDGMRGKVVVGTGVRKAPDGSLPGAPILKRPTSTQRTVKSLLKAKRLRVCLRANEPVKRRVKVTAIGKGGKALFRLTLSDTKLVDTGEDCVLSRALSARTLRVLKRFSGKNVAYRFESSASDFDGETDKRTTPAVKPKR